jgi:outer membrane protein TolC
MSAAPFLQALENVTLRQCYEWTRLRSAELESRREDIKQSQARARAALGGAFPRLEWEFTGTRQDPDGVKKLERKGFAGFVEKDQVESKFSLKQPLFSGLKEFSARSGFQKQSERDALLLDRASLEIFDRTAAAFYAVVGQETEKANTEAALALAQDRVKDLKGFKRLGKARDSEVFTAQAHAAALQASLRQIQSRIGSAREELSFLAGRDLSAMPLMDEIPNPPPVLDLQTAISQAKDRSDLRAQREEVAAKALRARYEKGSYWPTADVTGNYYTRRATFMDDIAWDAVLSLKVPLFQGGSVSARVREASSSYRQALTVLDQMERAVLYGVRRTHGELVSALGETESLEEAAQAAQKSYDALLEEYHLGLVTNLDVLQALDLLVSQKSARDAARLNAKRLFIQLNVAVEKLP